MKKSLLEGFEKINEQQMEFLLGGGTQDGCTVNSKGHADCGDQSGPGGTAATGVDEDSTRTSLRHDSCKG